MPSNQCSSICSDCIIFNFFIYIVSLSINSDIKLCYQSCPENYGRNFLKSIKIVGILSENNGINECLNSCPENKIPN